MIRGKWPDRARWPTLVLLLAVLAYILLYSAVSIYRHRGLNSSGFDLAIQDQVVWNTSRGRFFSSSVEVTNFLGDHVCPIAILLSPLAWLPALGVEWLLIAQSAALGLAAWPLHHLARMETRNRCWSLAIPISYLASPLPGFVNRFDFHFIAFSVPCLMTMLSLLRRRRLRSAAAWALLAAMCREEIGFAIAAVAVVALFRPATRRWGAIAATSALAWSLLACFVIIPYFRDAPSESLDRYGWLGDSASSIVTTLLTRPLFVLRGVLSDPIRLHTFAYLLWPLALLPLLAPVRALCILFPLSMPLLQDHAPANSIYYHYLAPSLPLLWWAAAAGAGRLRRGIARAGLPASSQCIAPVILILCTVLAWVQENPLTVTRPPIWEVMVGPPRPNVRDFRSAASMIGPQEAVMASMALAPHLSRREKIGIVGYVHTFDQPDCYLLDVSDFRWAKHPKDLADLLGRVIRSKQFGVCYWGGDIVLLRKGESDRAGRSEVLAALDRHLRERLSK